MDKSNKMKYVLNFVLPKENGGSKGKWKCDKCQKIFSSWEEVRLHKKDVHCY